MNDVLKISMCLISFVLITQTASAEEYLYTCVSEDKNSFHIKEGQVWKLGDKRWILVFVINTDEQSVYEKYAGELGGKETEIQNPYLKVITFSDKRISTMEVSNTHDEYSRTILYKTFFIDKNIMVATGHTAQKDFYISTWNCAESLI
ncbi:MAG: hypothetical protein CMK56_05625 [Proteobacteria bacterium]|nr:hypothetical protein [Pseudomonadota bacterium]